MNNEERFIEIAKNKAIIKQLQSEVDKNEEENRKTFSDDVKNFFISMGYEIEPGDKYHSNKYKFLNLRQIDENSTFNPGREPIYYIAGKNGLIVRFEWKLIKNGGSSQIYWYPEKQTLEDFYKRRLKKVIVLPIKAERKLKILKLNDNKE